MEGENLDDDLMADVNAHVHELAERLDPSGADHEPWKFMCECGDPDCHEQVWLTLSDYKQIRHRLEPVLASGHTGRRGIP